MQTTLISSFTTNGYHEIKYALTIMLSTLSQKPGHCFTWTTCIIRPFKRNCIFCISSCAQFPVYDGKNTHIYFANTRLVPIYLIFYMATNYILYVTLLRVSWSTKPLNFHMLAFFLQCRGNLFWVFREALVFKHGSCFLPFLGVILSRVWARLGLYHCLCRS